MKKHLSTRRKDPIQRIEEKQDLILQVLGDINRSEKMELMTSNEVMEYLKISRATFNRLKNDEIIKAYQLRGGRLLFKKNEIFEAIDNGLIEVRA